MTLAEVNRASDFFRIEANLAVARIGNFHQMANLEESLQRPGASTLIAAYTSERHGYLSF